MLTICNSCPAVQIGLFLLENTTGDTSHLAIHRTQSRSEGEATVFAYYITGTIRDGQI